MHVIIIGSGPAGVSAALYARRGGADVTVISKGAGGLTTAEWVENYYGFAEPISGAELEQRGIAGAERLGVRFETDEVLAVLPVEEGRGFRLEAACRTYAADAVILAAGASRRTLSIPGLRDFEGRLGLYRTEWQANHSPPLIIVSSILKRSTACKAWG